MESDEDKWWALSFFANSFYEESLANPQNNPII